MMIPHREFLDPGSKSAARKWAGIFGPRSSSKTKSWAKSSSRARGSRALSSTSLTKMYSTSLSEASDIMGPKLSPLGGL